MGDRIDSVDSEEFGLLFASFRYTAYRLEALQWYDVSYEREPVRRFVAGDAHVTDPTKPEWVSVIRNAVSTGRRMERVHVVTEPLSEYIRYELTCSYGPNVAAGEDIRILPVRQGEWPGDLPREDYWLFDSSDLWSMTYDDAGAFLRADLIRDPAAIVRACYWRDAAMHQAVTYDEYMRRTPGLRRAS